jgi:hypothetical protein
MMGQPLVWLIWDPYMEVLKSRSEAAFLNRAGIRSFDDPNHERSRERLAHLRAVRE